MASISCALDGCQKKVMARRLCDTHYKHARQGKIEFPPRLAVDCALCGTSFTPLNGGRKYCSDSCTSAAAWGFPAPLSCDECGSPMLAAKTSRRNGRRRCKECRRHGLGGYKRGCRCEVCAEAKREHMRVFNDKVRAEHGTSYKNFRAKRERERTGIRPGLAGGSYWIERAARLAIYERDNWTCHLCGEGIDPDAHWNGDRGASLDHLIPRSMGGTDDPDNLRTCHRACNSRRGVKDLEEVLADGW